MAMSGPEIERMIQESVPGATVTMTDLAGDGDHWSAHVVAEVFRGLPRVKQHQMVYTALQGKMGGELHALAIRTGLPDEPK